MPCTVDITIEQITADINQPTETVVLTVQDSPCVGGGGLTVSADENNRIELRADGLFVSNDLDPDPLAYYILAKS